MVISNHIKSYKAILNQIWFHSDLLKLIFILKPYKSLQEIIYGHIRLHQG